MGRYKKIDFTEAEYSAVAAHVSLGDKKLEKLATKMEKAMQPDEGEESMKLAELIAIAKKILGKRLIVPPFEQQTVVWRSKHSKFLCANFVTPEIVEQAARYAAKAWQGDIFIDNFVFQIIKLSSMPLFTPTASTVKTPIKTGFAAQSLFDE